MDDPLADILERPASADDPAPPASLANYDLVPVEGPNGRPTITRVGVPLPELADRLFRITAGWPKRIGGRLFAEEAGPAPLWLESPDALVAWLSRHLPRDGANPVQFVRGADKPTAGQLLAYLQQAAEAFAAVEQFPHEPALPRHYYMLPRLVAGTAGPSAA